MVTPGRGRTGRAPLGCLATLVVFGVFIYGVIKIGPPWLRYQQFRDEMHADAQFAISLPDSVIRSRLTMRADSLRLPPEAKKLIIRRNRARRTILIQATYSETIHFFLLGDKVITFRPKVEEAI
jgi:hypothetical protein